MRSKIQKERDKWVISVENNDFPVDVVINGKNVIVGYSLKLISASGDIDLIKEIMEKFHGSSAIVSLLQERGFKVFQLQYFKGEIELLCATDIEINIDMLAKEIKEIDGKCEMTAWEKVENRIGIKITCH
jgi:hypothetical protein